MKLFRQFSAFSALYLLSVSGSARRDCPREPVELLRLGSCQGLPDDADGEHPPPWSFEPFCIRSHTSTTLCVHSHAEFNERSGLALISTPEVAASVTPILQNTTAARIWRRHIAVRGHVQGQDIPYAVRAIPGRGMGVIATRDIKAFDIFMVSFPAVIADNELVPPEKYATPRAAWGMFQRGLERLGDQERFIALAVSGDDDMHVVEDVLRTNAFGIFIEGRGHKGLYPEASRMNHGCDPNAMTRFSTTTLALEAVATRDIKPGEEIVISYISLGMPYAHRARALSSWGFQCSCSMCSAPESQRRVSDRRRERLVEIMYALRDDRISYETVVSLTEEFLSIAKKERLTRKLDEYYHNFMRLYYEFGDLESAIKYGKLALEYAGYFDDPLGPFTKSLKENLANAQKMWDSTGS